MSNYDKYRFRYLAYKLEVIIWDSLLTECSYIQDIVNNPIRRIRV